MSPQERPFTNDKADRPGLQPETQSSTCTTTARTDRPHPTMRKVSPSVCLDFQIVEVLEDQLDEMYCSEWVRRAVKFLPVTAAASVVSGYTYWKLQFQQLLLLRALGRDMNTRIVFSLIELICSGERPRGSVRSSPVLTLALIVPTLFKAVLDTISVLSPAPRRPHLRLEGNIVPSVDIIITTCNEPTDVCLDTARAAINIDYPASRYRVIVTDDGENKDLRSGIEELARSKPGTQLFYTSRVKGQNDRHKAGNLNHALRFVRSLPDGASEFAAGLDADMIPMPDLLRAQLPHLILDPKLGFTCPAAVSAF